jgi:hypothetical protein
MFSKRILARHFPAMFAVVTIIIVASLFVPMLPPHLSSGTALADTSPTVSNAIVQNQQTSLTLSGNVTLYLYGFVTGGAYPTSTFVNGEYASVTDADGYLIAAMAITTSNTNSFSTSTVYHNIGGASVSGYSTYTVSYGSNSAPAAASASATFTVTTPGSLVVVLALAGGEQSQTLSGVPGLTIDATNNGAAGLPDVVTIAHAYPSTGTYTVTEQTAQTAAGQDPNHAGDLIGAIVFAPGTETSPTPTTTTLTSNAGLEVPSEGETITLTAQITPIPDGGTVQFLDNGTDLGGPVNVNASGQATYTGQTNLGQAARHTFTANYSGDANFGPSTGNLTQIVNIYGLLKIVSGTGMFSSISLANKIITVSPGQSLTGTITLNANNALAPDAVAPLIGTTSWGDHSSSWWLINGWIQTGSSTQTANVNVTAPTTPGTYYLLFAFQGELTGDQVASATNWAVGYDVWNDGNDIAGFSADQIAQAQEDGVTLDNRLYTWGYLESCQPSDAIEIIVGSSPTATGNLTVTVEDALSFQDIQGAVVQMTQTPSGQTALLEKSDSSGQCIFQNILPGSYTLIVSFISSGAVSYDPSTVQVTVYGGGTAYLNVWLTPSAVARVKMYLNNADWWAATGVASYGVYDYYSSFSPDVVLSNEVMGSAEIAALDQGISQTSTLQLNAWLEITTMNGEKKYFWLQNVVDFTPLGFFYTDNVWDWSNPSGLSANELTGGNGLIKQYENENVYAYSDVSNELSLWLPINIYSMISVVPTANGAEINFSFIQPQGGPLAEYLLHPQPNSLVTYDTVTLNLGTACWAPTLTVNPWELAPNGENVDAEFVWGGAPGGNNIAFNSLDADMGIFYMSNGVFQPFPAVFSFGLVTQETTSDLQVTPPAVDALASVSVPASKTQDNIFLTNDFSPSPTYSSSVPVVLGSGSLDATPITGVSVSVSGSSTLLSDATIITKDLPGQPTGTGVLDLSGSAFYDVQISGITDGTARVCITSPSVTAQTSMSYWNGTGWISATNTSVSGSTICGDIPVSFLDGTPIVVGIRATTQTTLSSSVNPSVYGQSVTFTATVSGLPPATSIPTGNVTFSDGGTVLGNVSLNSSGQATDTTSALSPGNHTITAVYSGDTNFTGSSGNLTQMVWYNFSGFLPTLGKSSYKLGSTIPIKWQLTDYNGNFIGELSTVVALLVGPVGGTLVAPTPSGGTVLRYDTTDNQYIFNWKTTGLEAGNYTISLSLNDGTIHTMQVTLQ